MCVEALQVARLGRCGIDEEILLAFLVAEVGRFDEVEIELAGVEELEDGDLVTSRREVADLFFEFLDRGEEVGEEDDEAAFADQVVESLHGRSEIGAFAGGGLFELEEDLPQLPRPIASGEVAVDAAIEGGETDRVLLAHQEIGEGGGEGRGVVGLRVGA